VTLEKIDAFSSEIIGVASAVASARNDVTLEIFIGFNECVYDLERA